MLIKISASNAQAASQRQVSHWLSTSPVRVSSTWWPNFSSIRPAIFATSSTIAASVTPPAQAGSALGTGLAWAVFSGFLFSVYSLMSRVSAGKLNPAQTAMWQNMAIALVLLPVVWTQLPQVRAMDWFWMAMLGVFCTGVAHSIFVASLSVLKARTASMFFALEPVYGIAIAWVLFHERPTPLMLVGGLLIIAAIALTSLRKAPEPAAAV